MRNRRLPFCFRLTLFALAVAAIRSASADLRIVWERPIDLGSGLYARVHRISGDRFMAAYSLDGSIVARFASCGNLREWTKPKVVAQDFWFEKGGGKVKVHLANAEFAQLQSGRIVYACNLRPAGQRHDIHPYSIAISTSDDGGETWSPLRIIYRAELAMAPDGAHHGCYEPFALPLRGNRAQIYFADESPYVEARCKWQNISVIETTDGGETWSLPRIACYTPQRRDGMPSVIEQNGWRYLCVEANNDNTRLHPQIVRSRVCDNWREPVLAPSQDRFDPFAEPSDWTKVYGGAPYVAATENYILLSWQETRFTDEGVASKTKARVAAMPKREIHGDGKFSTMRGVSTPPDVVPGADGMRWNSLCPTGGDTFLLVSEVDGRIIAYPGRINDPNG